jgi:hypothetical protein
MQHTHWFFRMLSVRLEQDVSFIGIAALAKLEHLQEFLYYHDDEDACDEEFFWLCLNLMPRLRVSGLRVKIELEPDIRFYGGYAKKAFKRMMEPLTSALSLRQLAFDRSSEMPMGVALPDLQTLFLISPRHEFSLLGFSSVTELGLEDLNQEQFEQILSEIGHQLLSLAVELWDPLYVDRVFKLCPKLQKFFITEVPRPFAGVNEPPEEHKCLVEFGFANKFFQGNSHFQPNHLLQILQAMPNLNVWRIKNYLFSEQEFELICETLEQKSILQNLEQFHLVKEIGDCSHEYLVSSMKVADKLLRSLIDHCPKLASVKLEK